MPTLTACNDWCALRLTATASSTAPHPSLPRLPHDLPTRQLTIRLTLLHMARMLREGELGRSN